MPLFPSKCSQACLLGLLLSPVLPAQNPQPAVPGLGGPEALKRLSLEQLSLIEVTSPNKTPEPASRTPMAIYVITGEQIRRSGATSIPEALRLAPGVHVARITANQWSIGIRGFGSRLSRSVLVLIDGRTVYTTFFAGTYWEVQDTLLDDIDRIEVIRGPGGTVWGPNAVNGVINIITKPAQDTHGTLVSAGGGNEEQGFTNFRYGSGNGKGLDYRVYGKAFTRGPGSHPDGRNFDDWRAAQAGFRADYRRNSRDTFTFSGDIYQQAAGQRVEVISYTQPFSRIEESNAALSGGNVMGQWTRTNGEGSDIQIQAYYDRTSRLEANFGEIRDTFDVDYIQRRQWTARQKISWGLGARFSKGTAQPMTSGLTFDPLTRTDRLLTGFVQDEIGLVEGRLSLIAGSKILHTNFTALAFEPSVRLLWTPTGKQTVWAAFTHGVRTPSRAERDFFLSGYINTTEEGTPFFARFNANRNFQAEQLNGYEVGYRRLFGTTLYVDVATFYNRYHNLFSQELTGAPFLETTPAPTHLLLPAQFGNGLMGTTSGVEIAPEWKAADFWRISGSWSFLGIDLRKPPGSADIGTAPFVEGSTPQHQVVIQSAINFLKSWELDLTYRYSGSLPALSIPGYSTGDARLAWRVHREFELSFAGRNLLQPSHPEYAFNAGPPVGVRRSAYVRLTWSR